MAGIFQKLQGNLQNVMNSGGGGANDAFLAAVADEAALPDCCQSADDFSDPLRAGFERLAKRAEKCVVRKHPEEALVDALRSSGESLRQSQRANGEQEILERVLLSLAESEQALIDRRNSQSDSLAEWTEAARRAELSLAGLQSDRRALGRTGQDLSKLRRRLLAGQTKQQQQQAQQSQHQQQTAEAALNELQMELANRENEERKQRDSYIVRLNELLLDRPRLCNQLLDLMRARLAYHRQCADLLEERLPALEEAVASAASLAGPCYGVPLEEHLARTNRQLAYVIDVCTAALNRDDILIEEGLFRLNGPSGSVQKLESFLNVMRAESEISRFDSATVCGTLKKYLKQLPEPLVSQALLSDWAEACDTAEADSRRFRLHACCQRLQQDRPCLYNNLRHLVKFLARVAQHQDRNKMSPKNLAICIGPNIAGGANMEEMHSANLGTLIVENLLLMHDFCFGAEDLRSPPAERRAVDAALSVEVKHPESKECASDDTAYMSLPLSVPTQQPQLQQHPTLPPKPKLPLSRQLSGSDSVGAAGGGGSKQRQTILVDTTDGPAPRRPGDPRYHLDPPATRPVTAYVPMSAASPGRPRKAAPPPPPPPQQQQQQQLHQQQQQQQLHQQQQQQQQQPPPTSALVTPKAQKQQRNLIEQTESAEHSPPHHEPQPPPIPPARPLAPPPPPPPPPPPASSADPLDLSITGKDESEAALPAPLAPTPARPPPPPPPAPKPTLPTSELQNSISSGGPSLDSVFASEISEVEEITNL